MNCNRKDGPGELLTSTRDITDIRNVTTSCRSVTPGLKIIGWTIGRPVVRKNFSVSANLAEIWWRQRLGGSISIFPTVFQNFNNKHKQFASLNFWIIIKTYHKAICQSKSLRHATKLRTHVNVKFVNSYKILFDLLFGI